MGDGAICLVFYSEDGFFPISLYLGTMDVSTFPL
jgi:hypothetical protein